MLPDFAATVRALTEAFVARVGGEAERVDTVEAFLLAAHARMPDHLRINIRAATLCFDAWPLLRRGRTFHRLPLALRNRQIAAWETSHFTPLRGLMTFYGSFATFRLHCSD
jgi:hypothetical protein